VSTSLRGARAALVFLTRVPVGGFPYTKDEWRWSSAWFPAVGALVGAASAGVWLLLEPAGVWVAAAFAVTASMLLTGGLHEDGLADTADALGGGADRDAVLHILKDPRVGSFGALALVVSVLLRVALVASLAGTAPIALVLAHTLARVGPVWLMVALLYVTGDGAKSRDVTRARTPQGAVATALGALALATAVSFGVTTAAGAARLVVALATLTIFLAWRFRARVGGVTGDFLGATEQVGEVAVLTVLALA
jgi:adenosylcobinamide-GDP ribazoletransferase